jgi:hypothetical protein
MSRRRSAWSLRTRMQPAEAACPIEPGSLVPCTAIGLSRAHPWGASEKPAMARMAGPKTPCGSRSL